MLVRHSLTLTLICVWAISLPAQVNPKIDTLHTDEGATNMLLNIKVPSGEMYLTSSGLCGKSLSSLSSSREQASHKYSSKVAVNGTVRRSIDVQYGGTGSGKAINSGSVATMRLANPGTPVSYRSEYKQDPSLDTELVLDLGSGGAMLDLSDMSISRVVINSAFSDVLVSYSKPNLVSMDEMEIHTARAKITLKNLEMARAKRIQVRNEMGDTKLVLGNNGRPASKIFVKSGVGDCMLIIDRNQPTKIVLEGGMFSKIEVEESFKPHGKGTYVNKAYYSNPGKCTTVFCEVDLGNISLMAK